MVVAVVGAGSILFLLRFLVALYRDHGARRTYYALVLTAVEIAPLNFAAFRDELPGLNPRRHRLASGQRCGQIRFRS